MTAIDPERRERNRQLREQLRGLPPHEYARARDAILRGQPITIPTKSTKAPTR